MSKKHLGGVGYMSPEATVPVPAIRLFPGQQITILLATTWDQAERPHLIEHPTIRIAIRPNGKPGIHIENMENCGADITHQRVRTDIFVAKGRSRGSRRKPAQAKAKGR